MKNIHAKEVKERWGHTEAYKQSILHTKNWKKEDYERVKNDGDELIKKIVAQTGRGIKSPEIQKLIVEWRKNINQFYDTTIEMCRNLAEMYITDKRFTRYYETYQKGLAQFMHDAIIYYCKNN